MPPSSHREVETTCKFCGSTGRHHIIETWDTFVPVSDELVAKMREMEKSAPNDGRYFKIDQGLEFHRLVVCDGCGRTHEEMYGETKAEINMYYPHGDQGLCG